MKVTRLDLPEIILIEPRVFADPRGHFLETYQAERYRQHNIPVAFVQDNLSFSHHGVVRGLHYQLRQPQGKLVMVLAGEVFDVVVDIRRDSPRFGRWVTTVLSAGNCRQLYIPPGFAHGFCVIGDSAVFFYKCTDYYNPGDEYGIIWNDPDLNIHWPTDQPVLSDKDLSFRPLRDVPVDHLPLFPG